VTDREVTQFLPLVRTVASRMAARLPRGVDLDDLVGAGVLGLLSAARQYDGDKGVPFQRYAEIRIRGAILDELRSMDQTSRHSRRQSGEVTNMARSLATTLGRAPTHDEVAGGLGVTLERYHELVGRVAPVVVVGFDDVGLNQEDEKRDVLQYLRDPGAEDPAAETGYREAALRVAAAIDRLTDRQRQVVTFYYFEGMSAREIADLLGVTEGRVSQLHTAATERLKTLLAATDG
jgi:RNA polymerase sigma factor FliA